MSQPNRFWTCVEKTDSCWLWRGTVHHTGYGVLTIMDESRPSGRRQVRAHRLSYELAVGPIPDGQSVCHRCDVRICVNPDHLFLGTAADNWRDAMAKGRTVHTPGALAGAAAVRDRWQNDPEFRATQSRKRSQSNASRWNDPAFRERMSAKLREIAINRESKRRAHDVRA